MALKILVLSFLGAATDNLPSGVLYKVIATYKYTQEDVDELSFDVGEIINVVEYEDPEEQVSVKRETTSLSFTSNLLFLRRKFLTINTNSTRSCSNIARSIHLFIFYVFLQEEGWLMGVKESTGEKGMFPGNFTKPCK